MWHTAARSPSRRSGAARTCGTFWSGWAQGCTWCSTRCALYNQVAVFYNQVAVFRSPGFDRGKEKWGGPEEMEQVFAAACEPVLRALPGLGRQRWWPMADREPISCWTKDRLALLGDAAHPMLQYLAQGACQALEDATTPADALTRRPPADWPTALEMYAAVRGPGTARVQSTARIWGEMWHVEGVAALLRDEVFKAHAEDDLGPAEWLWGSRAA